ncbi:MAG: recombination regulator RecX [Tissierellales bacterium]|jgi:regulatory protein|nr:recombination regulator RecX [Tissierellales bacterium]
MATIIKIKITQAKKAYCEVHLDDGRVISAHIETVYKHFLDKGKSIDEELIYELIVDFDYIKLREYATNVISRRFYTEREIRNKLGERSEYNKNIELVIEKLREYNYIDDALYAERYIKDAKRLKKYGDLKIRAMLSQKGVDDGIITRKLNETKEDLEDIEFENLLKLCLKKSITLKETDKYKKRQKLYAYLARRGYDSYMIKRAIDNVEEQGEI